MDPVDSPMAARCDAAYSCPYSRYLYPSVVVAPVSWDVRASAPHPLRGRCAPHRQVQYSDVGARMQHGEVGCRPIVGRDDPHAGRRWLRRTGQALDRPAAAHPSGSRRRQGLASALWHRSALTPGAIKRQATG